MMRRAGQVARDITLKMARAVAPGVSTAELDELARDEMERSVIGAIGPQGQSPIAPVRAAAATADAVRGIAERLVGAGLAVPDGAGTTVAEAVRQVRLAVPAVAGLATAALLMPVPSDMPRFLVALWFALPLALTLGCLAIARFDPPVLALGLPGRSAPAGHPAPRCRRRR